MSEDYTRERADYPRSVQVAGLFWIVFGCLIILNAVAGLIMSFSAPGPNQGNPMGWACSAGCSGLFAAAFLLVGVQTIKGTARDTLGNGIGSIGIGVLYAGFGGIMIALARSSEARIAFAGVTGGISILGGIGLLVAGILALIGRSAYREWREENYPSTVRTGRRRRRKRRRPRDDDEEDELEG